MMIRIILVLSIVLSFGRAQKFEEILLDLGNAAVQPWAGQECNDPNQWSYDLDTPEEWGVALGDIDLFTHVGLEFGCHQLDKKVGLVAEAKKTHTVAYGGGLTPLSMFTVNFAAGTNLSGIASGNFEQLNVGVGLGYVAATLNKIVEVDPQGNIAKELQFNLPQNALALEWRNEKWATLADGVYRTSFSATPNFTLINSDGLGQLATEFFLGIPDDFKLTFDFLTSEKYGVLETVPPTPLNALGAEVVVKVENWKFKDSNNRLGLQFLVMQKPAEVKKEAHAVQLLTKDKDRYSSSYFHFPTSTEGTGDLNISYVHLDLDSKTFEQVELPIIGNPFMAIQAAAAFGVSNAFSADKCSFHQVTVTTVNPGESSVHVDAGFGVGQYPYQAVKDPNADPSCDDGVLNGNELGVDCGQKNATAPGCSACPEECHFFISAHCLNCNDGKQNGDETCVDAGGILCKNECASCSNFKKDPGEEDIDCGGICPPCAPAHCGNGVKDMDEEGSDCGGSCPACSQSQLSTATNQKVASVLAFLSFILAFSF